MKNKITLLFIGLLLCGFISAQKQKVYSLQSPGGSIRITVTAGEKLSWTASQNGQVIISPSGISLKVKDGIIMGNNITELPRVKVSLAILSATFNLAAR